MIMKGQIYKHFKGNYYYIEDLAYNANNNKEDLEFLVIYRALYGDNRLWVRSLREFTSPKEMPDGTKIERFSLVTIPNVK